MAEKVQQENQIRFAAEHPVGKLSKWLRLLGFDTMYEQDVTPEEFTAAGRHRILLRRTQKNEREWPSNRILLIESDDPFEQLKEVIRGVGMTVSDLKPFSRCTHCNVPVHEVDKGAVRSKVPDYIWEICNTFHACANCERIYWPGSHTKRSAVIIERLFKSL